MLTKRAKIFMNSSCKLPKRTVRPYEPVLSRISAKLLVPLLRVASDKADDTDDFVAKTREIIRCTALKSRRAPKYLKATIAKHLIAWDRLGSLLAICQRLLRKLRGQMALEYLTARAPELNPRGECILGDLNHHAIADLHWCGGPPD
jgi:hypothetical protein